MGHNTWCLSIIIGIIIYPYYHYYHCSFIIVIMFLSIAVIALTLSSYFSLMLLLPYPYQYHQISYHYHHCYNIPRYRNHYTPLIIITIAFFSSTLFHLFYSHLSIDQSRVCGIPRA